MKIVRTDSRLQTPVIDRRLREWGHELVCLADGIDEDSLCQAVKNAGLILMCYTPITQRVIDSAPGLRGIVKYGVGIDAIDIPAAHARGIAVVNVPEYAEQTVAEGAFALLIALAKKLTALHLQMQGTGWACPEQAWLASDIAGKTLGLIGAGKIGRQLARMAGMGFGVRVLAYDPFKTREEMALAGIEKYDDCKAMLAECDFVSIHAVLHRGARALVGKDELAAMKKSAFLINTARGALVDEGALLTALEQKQIAGAGLDVFSEEPLNRTDHALRKLFQMDNVILTPHISFYTVEAMQRLEQETLERCAEIIAGRPVTIKSDDKRLAGLYG